MDRCIEPQLVDDVRSVEVLANSFSMQEANFLLENIKRYFLDSEFLEILDLCCGTGDFAIVLAENYNGNIDAVDGSLLVLEVANNKIVNAGFDNRITTKHLYAPFLIDKKYDLIYSLSSLHHFHNPNDFWLTIKNHTKENTKILVIDTHRPPSKEVAKTIVDTYENGESEWHQAEAYNSLLASFESSEVVEQLRELQLDLKVETIKTKLDGFSFIVVWGEI